MKTKKSIVCGFLAVVLMLAFAACSGSGGGGKSLNSAEALKEYLDKQTANSPDQPIKVTMKVNDMMIKDIVEVLNNAGKYVSLDLSDSPLKEIPQGAFIDCKTLVSITIPNGVTSIGAFSYSLTSITVDSGNPNYASEGGILYNKAKTEIVYVPRGKNGNIIIPNSVTSIGEQAFNNCTGLTDITISAGVTSIVSYAFYGCTGLTGNITIPAGVMSIGQGAFSNCTGLTSVTFAADSQLQTIGDYAFRDCTSLTSVTIPNSVTSIGEAAFCDCTSLTRITIPSSVTYIGDNAFRNCTSLTSVTIQSGVTSIVRFAFFGCSSLTSVTIPSSVTSIGIGAFWECTSLTSVTISRRTALGEQAFPPQARITYSD